MIVLIKGQKVRKGNNNVCKKEAFCGASCLPLKVLVAKQNLFNMNYCVPDIRYGEICTICK